MSQEMFSKNTAVEFLHSSWGVKNVEERLENDRKNLLDEIVRLTLANVPFQSITFMATPSEQRKCPTYEEIKKNGMQGIGGLCYSLNTFVWLLLKGLGFSAKLALSTVTSTVTSPNNHFIVLVSDVEKKNDLSLVDCGTGFPIFRAVSLNFDQESPVYHDSFLEYKYVRHDGKILRMHGKGDMVKPNDPPIEGLDFFMGRWRRFCSFDPEQPDPTFDPNQIYLPIIDLTPFPKSPRAIVFPEKRAVIAIHNRLIIENDKGSLETTVMASDEEILKAYVLHFANIKQDTVRRALEEWHCLSK